MLRSSKIKRDIRPQVVAVTESVSGTISPLLVALLANFVTQFRAKASWLEPVPGGERYAEAVYNVSAEFERELDASGNFAVFIEGTLCVAAREFPEVVYSSGLVDFAFITAQVIFAELLEANVEQKSSARTYDRSGVRWPYEQAIRVATQLEELGPVAVTTAFGLLPSWRGSFEDLVLACESVTAVAVV